MELESTVKTTIQVPPVGRFAVGHPIESVVVGLDDVPLARSLLASAVEVRIRGGSGNDEVEEASRRPHQGDDERLVT
jgi:hypothetical protein